MLRTKFKTKPTFVHVILEILLFNSFHAHDTYLCGPITTFHGGVKYFFIFIDDFSMKTKFDEVDKLKVFKSFVKIKLEIISR
jgi:hypothetical protein